MDTRKIAQLARLMGTYELSEITIESADQKLTLKRGRPLDPLGGPVLAAQAVGSVPCPSPRAPAESAPPEPPASPGTCIVSPIVGTFYAAPAPDAAPFVRPGEKVSPETVVCIVEAMKVMNEVKAEISGVVRRVLVESGTPVEFGQPLFEIEPG
jgi:acetyl-CoA carboxylase biotin carboxyl carrier protein